MKRNDVEGVEALGRAMARLIREELHSDWSFAIAMFQIGPGGAATYVSDGKRRDMIAMFRALADQLESGTPGRGIDLEVK